MKPMRLPLICGCMLLCLTADAAHALTYKATLLNQPAGYFESAATGVDGSIVVGNTNAFFNGGNNGFRALLWNGTTVVNLQPAGFRASIANAVSGNVQVGYALDAGLLGHAMMWTGTADSAVQLIQTSFYDSSAYGIYGDSIVGHGRDTATRALHALLWHGTNSVIDLQPPGLLNTYAQAVSETKQYGYGGVPGFPGYHALLWRGSATSYTDLHPDGFAASKILAGTETTQVGEAYASADLSGPHAFLWHDTASSAIDLNPTGFVASSAAGAFGDYQVGWGSGGYTHALLWHGSANDVVDLHQYLANLPINFVESQAVGIDANGNIVGVAWGNGYERHAVLWTPTVPEPHSGLALFCGMVGLRLAACRKRA